MSNGSRQPWVRLVTTVGVALVLVAGAGMLARATRPVSASRPPAPTVPAAVAGTPVEAELPMPLGEALDADTAVDDETDEAAEPAVAPAAAAEGVAARVRAQTQKSMQKRLAKQRKRELAARAAVSERAAGGWTFRPKGAQGVAATVQGSMLTLVASDRAVGACGAAVPVRERAVLVATWRALDLTGSKPARLSTRWLDQTGAVVKVKGTAMGSLAGPAPWVEVRASPVRADGAAAVQLCVDVPPGSGVVQVREVAVLADLEALPAEGTGQQLPAASPPPPGDGPTGPPPPADVPAEPPPPAEVPAEPVLPDP